MRSPRTDRRFGFLGIVGGIVFAPYALTKSSLASAVVDGGWSTPVTTPDGTALLIHLFETVPVLLLLAGLLGYVASRWRAIGSFGRLGAGVLVVGFVAVALTHAGEHALPTIPVAGLPGEGGVLVYGYLLSWVVIESGQALLGLAVLRADGNVTPAAGTLALSLPVAVGLGLAAVATGTYTFGGVHRIVQATVGVIVGRSLWNGNDEVTTTDVPARS